MVILKKAKKRNEKPEIFSPFPLDLIRTPASTCT